MLHDTANIFTDLIHTTTVLHSSPATGLSMASLVDSGRYQLQLPVSQGCPARKEPDAKNLDMKALTRPHLVRHHQLEGTQHGMAQVSAVSYLTRLVALRGLGTDQVRQRHGETKDSRQNRGCSRTHYYLAAYAKPLMLHNQQIMLAYIWHGFRLFAPAPSSQCGVVPCIDNRSPRTNLLCLRWFTVTIGQGIVP